MEFKEGDWVIRKWNEEWNREVDFARIEKCEENGFWSSQFFRFSKNIRDLTYVDRWIIPYIDEDRRMEYDWRKATDEELTEYLILEKTPFEI